MVSSAPLALLVVVGIIYWLEEATTSDYYRDTFLYRPTVYTVETITTSPIKCTPQSQGENCFVGVLLVRPSGLNVTCPLTVEASLNRVRDDADFYVRERFGPSVPVVGSYKVVPGTEDLATCTFAVINPPTPISIVGVYVCAGLLGIVLLAGFLGGLMACCHRDRTSPFGPDECCTYFLCHGPLEN